MLGQVATGERVALSDVDELAWSIIRAPELASEAREAIFPEALATVQAEPAHKLRRLVTLAKLLLERACVLTVQGEGVPNING